MEDIKTIGNYLQCPYCKKLFGNGISIVWQNMVKACNYIGMKQAVQLEKFKLKR
jgi:hypothetical protein